MVSTGRTAGSLMVGAAALILLAAAGLLGTQLATGETTPGGAALGLLLVLVVAVLPLGAAGLFLRRRGRAEEAELAHLRRVKKLFGMAQAQGTLSFAEAALELSVSRSEVEDLVRELVTRDLFTGAISWKDGILFSSDAAALREGRSCPSCGGAMELAGKGMIACPYCGAEVFIG